MSLEAAAAAVAAAAAAAAGSAPDRGSDEGTDTASATTTTTAAAAAASLSTNVLVTPLGARVLTSLCQGKAWGEEARRCSAGGEAAGARQAARSNALATQRAEHLYRRAVMCREQAQSPPMDDDKRRRESREKHGGAEAEGDGEGEELKPAVGGEDEVEREARSLLRLQQLAEESEFTLRPSVTPHELIMRCTAADVGLRGPVGLYDEMERMKRSLVQLYTGLAASSFRHAASHVFLVVSALRALRRASGKRPRRKRPHVEVDPPPHPLLAPGENEDKKRKNAPQDSASAKDEECGEEKSRPAAHPKARLRTSLPMDLRAHALRRSTVSSHHHDDLGVEGIEYGDVLTEREQYKAVGRAAATVRNSLIPESPALRMEEPMRVHYIGCTAGVEARSDWLLFLQLLDTSPGGAPGSDDDEFCYSGRAWEFSFVGYTSYAWRSTESEHAMRAAAKLKRMKAKRRARQSDRRTEPREARRAAQTQTQTQTQTDAQTKTQPQGGAEERKQSSGATGGATEPQTQDAGPSDGSPAAGAKEGGGEEQCGKKEEGEQEDEASRVSMSVREQLFGGFTNMERDEEEARHRDDLVLRRVKQRSGGRFRAQCFRGHYAQLFTRNVLGGDPDLVIVNRASMTKGDVSEWFRIFQILTALNVPVVLCGYTLFEDDCLDAIPLSRIAAWLGARVIVPPQRNPLPGAVPLPGTTLHVCPQGVYLVFQGADLKQSPLKSVPHTGVEKAALERLLLIEVLHQEIRMLRRCGRRAEANVFTKHMRKLEECHMDAPSGLPVQVLLEEMVISLLPARKTANVASAPPLSEYLERSSGDVTNAKNRKPGYKPPLCKCGAYACPRIFVHGAPRPASTPTFSIVGQAYRCVSEFYASGRHRLMRELYDDHTGANPKWNRSLEELAASPYAIGPPTNVAQHATADALAQGSGADSGNGVGAVPNGASGGETKAKAIPASGSGGGSGSGSGNGEEKGLAGSRTASNATSAQKGGGKRGGAAAASAAAAAASLEISSSTQPRLAPEHEDPGNSLTATEVKRVMQTMAPGRGDGGDGVVSNGRLVLSAGEVDALHGVEFVAASSDVRGNHGEEKNHSAAAAVLASQFVSGEEGKQAVNDWLQRVGSVLASDMDHAVEILETGASQAFPPRS